MRTIVWNTRRLVTAHIICSLEGIQYFRWTCSWVWGGGGSEEREDPGVVEEDVWQIIIDVLHQHLKLLVRERRLRRKWERIGMIRGQGHRLAHRVKCPAAELWY
jgi:hypothetical protein